MRESPSETSAFTSGGCAATEALAASRRETAAYLPPLHSLGKRSNLGRTPFNRIRAARMDDQSALGASLSRRELFIHGGRAVGVMAGAGAFASVLAACGGSSAGTGSVGSAGSGLTLTKVMHATGNVKVLGFSGYQVPQSTPSGMTATWGYNTTNEQIITKTTQPGSFDLVIIYQGEIDQLRQLNRIVPLDISLIPNWKSLNPYFQHTPVIRRNGQIWALPQHWGYNYTQYNADKIGPPTTFQDLLSPKLHSKVGLPDDPYAVITTFAFFAGYGSHANDLTQSQFNNVLSLLHRFRSQVLTIHQYGEENQLFARGDIWVDLPSYSNSFLLTRKAGVNAKYTLLGSWSYVDCYMLLAAATNPAGGYRYMNQAISLPAQIASTKKSLAFPVLDAAVNALPQAMQYKTATQVLQQAPLQAGVTVKTGGPYVPFSQWLQAWEQYKSA